MRCDVDYCDFSLIVTVNFRKSGLVAATVFPYGGIALNDSGYIIIMHVGPES